MRERGSLRSRSAASISGMTLRQISQALPRLTPEARPAMRRIASFISQALGDNTIDQAAG